MPVTCYMKDGNSIVLASGDNFKPWPSDENFVQVLDANAVLVAIVPVVNLDVAARTS